MTITLKELFDIVDVFGVKYIFDLFDGEHTKPNVLCTRSKKDIPDEYMESQVMVICPVENSLSITIRTDKKIESEVGVDD